MARAARRLKASSRFAKMPIPALWWMTDEGRTPDPLAVAARLPPGTGVVLRHYGARHREEIARALVGLARRRGLCLLIAGDEALAARVGADGVHWPAWMAGCGTGTDGGRRWLRAASAHNPRELARAQMRGADLVFLSPVLETPSHPGARSLGPIRFAALARAARLPVIALGGLGPDNAGRVLGSCAAGLAGVGFALDDAVPLRT